MDKQIFQIAMAAFFLFSSNLIAQPKWQTSASGNNYKSWKKHSVGSGFPHHTFELHDFDGDGITDVFTSYKGAFQYSSGGKTLYRTLNTRFKDENNYGKGVKPEQLRFGDFDGDGKTDVLFPWKGNFVYCSGGKGNPIVLRKADIPIQYIRLGDFDGDGITDIFVLSH